LNTIRKTHASPKTHPYIKLTEILSFVVIKCETRPVSIGAVATSRETFDAVLNERAKFSQRK